MMCGFGHSLTSSWRWCWKEKDTRGLHGKCGSKKRGKKAGLPRRGSVALYRIKRGDTLAKIARRFKTDAETIMGLNRSRIEHPAFLEVGMKIRVPASGKKKRRKKIASRKKTRKKGAPAN